LSPDPTTVQAASGRGRGNISRWSIEPEGATVPVEFLPKERGEFEFTCQMGMFRGKIVVE